MTPTFFPWASKRFIDENATESFKLLTKDGNDVKKGSNVPDDWVKGHTSADEAHEAQFMIAMASSSNPLKQIVKSQAEKESIQNVTELVSHSVPEKHLKYKTMRELYDKFMKKMGVGHLLSMYTLETPLYKNYRLMLIHLRFYAIFILMNYKIEHFKDDLIVVQQ